jgi:tetratricopeptide (TPR) repeat protein
MSEITAAEALQSVFDSVTFWREQAQSMERQRNEAFADLAAALADLERVRVALDRYEKAHTALEMANNNKNPDGTPLKPYQWEGAQDNAQGDYWDAREKLLDTHRVLGPAGREDVER